MVAKSASSDSIGGPGWLATASCLLAATAAFAWLPDSLWNRFLPFPASRFFLPAFASAFAAGWLVGAWRQSSGLSEEEGAIRSKASISGLLAALVACAAAYAASLGSAAPPLPLVLALVFLFLSILPSALFATVGANLGHRTRRRQTVLGGAWGGRERVLALAVSATLPAAGVLVWPAVYVLGKVLEKPPIVVVAAPTPAVALPPPQPRYVKPEGFDSANAWKRIVSHEDAIPNADSKSPVKLSRDERRLAFVVRERGEYQLVVRHLYDPGPDYSLTLDGGIAAMSWSQDDKRIIFLSGESGAIWVCVPESGKMIRLPIPVLEKDQRHALVWWREESVVVYPSRGDPGILSLDSLRITAATKDPEWSKLKEDERMRIGQEAFPPDMGRTAKAKFSFIGGTGDASRVLAINDEESLYSRLAASAERGFASAFPNRDGTMFFIMEPDRLRILYMGLRQAPSLRFIAEAKGDFPAVPAVKTALEKRSVRAAVAAPIINPLNSKTVAGDPRAIKGYARFIAATDKTCSVWIEQERQPIREGDVLIMLSAIQDGDEYSVSPDWWAVIKAADDNQSIPRRADVTILLPSSTRVLLPLPEPAPKPTPVIPERGAIATPPPQVATPPPANPTSSSIPKVTPPTIEPPKPAPKPPEPKVTDEERVRAFVVGHHRKLTERDLDGVVGTYGAVATVNGTIHTREQIREIQREIFSQKSHIIESVDGEIDVERGTNNTFKARYQFMFEARIPRSDDQRGYGRIEMEVRMTDAGPKISKKTLRVDRTEFLKGR